MIKNFTLFGLLFSLSLYSLSQTVPFTPGNLVVVRVGDGSGTLSNAAAPVFLDEYTTTGVLVQTIPLPTTSSGINYALTISGSANSEGALNLSPNEQFLTVGGYDAAPGTADVPGTSSSIVRRVVGIIDANGNVNTSTGLTDAYTGTNIRSAVTTNGTSIWTGGPTGVRYTTIGSSSSTSVASSVNARVVSIYNNQLYVSSGAGSFEGVNTVGSGMPTASGQTVTLLPGFTARNASTPRGPVSVEPYAFDISPDGSTIYVTNDAGGLAGGVQKWIYNSATSQYEYQYTIKVAPNVGLRGLTVDWFAYGPNNSRIMYATSANNFSSATESRLYRVVDNGDSISSTHSPLATASAGTLTQAFRGVAFAPYTYLLPVNLISFTAAAHGNSTAFNWKTATERNTRYFEIQQSPDGRNFTMLATLPAAGNSTTEKNYSYTGVLPTATTYYRLKTVDADSKFSLSAVVKITPSKNGFVLGNVYPVPAKNNVTVEWNSSRTGATTISLTDISGRTLRTLQVNSVAGFNRQIVDVQRLAPGEYYLQLVSPNGKLLTILTKQ